MPTFSRQSQQDPRHYVTTTHKTRNGEKAIKIEMTINVDLVEQEETLDARPVYLSRQDRIKSHFLICFLAMVILKILQRQLTGVNPDLYKTGPVPIDQLIPTLRGIRFAHLPGSGYLPMFNRTDLTDQLQNLAGVNISTQIIPTRTMTANYRNVKV